MATATIDFDRNTDLESVINERKNLFIKRAYQFFPVIGKSFNEVVMELENSEVAKKVGVSPKLYPDKKCPQDKVILYLYRGAFVQYITKSFAALNLESELIATRPQLNNIKEAEIDYIFELNIWLEDMIASN